LWISIRATPPLLSAIQARRSIRCGAQAFLAYIKALPEGVRKLEDIPVVRDYPDVFAEVTTGLPPDREIEFTIVSFYVGCILLNKITSM
jgi:hypothetical protein